MLVRIRKVLEKNKIIYILLNNYNVRTIIFSVVSLIGGMLYTIFNIILSSISESLWYGAIICYYLLLVFLRSYLIFDNMRKTKKGFSSKWEEQIYEIKKYRLCGILFMIVTIILSAMIYLIVNESKVFQHHILIVYIIAGFTLFRIGIAIYNYIKVKRNDRYLIRSLRCINLVTALVSILSFQSIALTNFSQNLNINITNAITGLIICITIIFLSLFMIITANLKLNVIRKVKKD